MAKVTSRFPSSSSCNSSDSDSDSSTHTPVDQPKANKNHPVIRLQKFCVRSVRHHSTLIRRTVVLFCLFGYFVYMGFSIKHSLYLATPLLIITGAVGLIILYTLVRDNFGEEIYNSVCVPSNNWIDKQWHWLKW